MAQFIIAGKLFPDFTRIFAASGILDCIFFHSASVILTPYFFRNSSAVIFFICSTVPSAARAHILVHLFVTGSKYTHADWSILRVFARIHSGHFAVNSAARSPSDTDSIFQREFSIMMFFRVRTGATFKIPLFPASMISRPISHALSTQFKSGTAPRARASVPSATYVHVVAHWRIIDPHITLSLSSVVLRDSSSARARA